MPYATFIKDIFFPKSTRLISSSYYYAISHKKSVSARNSAKNVHGNGSCIHFLANNFILEGGGEGRRGKEGVSIAGN